MIQIAAAAAHTRDLDEALQTIFSQIPPEIATLPIHLGICFATNHFDDRAQELMRRVRQAGRIQTLIGCNAESVIGPDRELELTPAIVLWLAHLPNTDIQPVHIRQEQIELAETHEEYRRIFKVSDPKNSTLILIGDPFSINITQTLDALNSHLPGLPVVGGMASGANAPGESILTLNDELMHDGAIGVVLRGGVKIQTIISQGCRPIGKPYLITQGEHNLIHALGGRSPLEVINELYQSVSQEEQALMARGLFIGRVIDEYKDEFRRGDFLIRNIMGADHETGSVAVLDQVHPGITMQFHLRDAETAEEDLRALLNTYTDIPPKGALLFSCNGRGTRMFTEEDHDLNILREKLAAPPTAGFFCAGELGPVGGKNFIHGHTACIAIFDELD